MTIATTAAVVGIGAAGYSMYNQYEASHGKGGGVQGGGTYTPQGQPQADTDWQTLMQNYMSQQQAGQGMAGPAIDQGMMQMLALNPQMLQQYGGLAGLAQQYQQMMGGQAGNLMGAGNQLWQTAQDPQNQLRGQLQQQVTDASRAGTSARGIGTSGEAAGIENQDVSNFLMNWQNQQLQRQATGLQGLGQATQQGGQGLAGAMSMGALSPQFLQAGAQWPMQAGSMYTAAQNPLLQQLIAGMGATNPYMGLGQSASNLGFGQQQTGLNNLTTGLSQLAKLYNQPGAGGGGGGWGGGTAGSEDPTAGGTFNSGAW